MNNITLNWSQEDRLRIDKLIGLLEQVVVAAEAANVIERITVDEDLNIPEAPKAPFIGKTLYTPENPAEMPPEVLAEVEQEQTPQEPETAQDEPQAVENEAPAPTYTAEDVRTKAKELTAAGKRAEAKAIVNEYAESITDLPADKCDEVMARLTALGG